MGVKICPECGGKVSESRNTCIHCGYTFPAPKETKKCPDCEADVDIDVKECPECGYIFETKTEEPKEGKVEEKPTKKEKEPHVHNVTCSSCGSGDLEQLDEYTYRCNNCQNIVKVKKPDVNVYNINSYAGDSKTEDVPVYQVVKDLDEGTFVRDCVLHLAHAENVSPTFLENFRVDKSMVSLAYLTYISREYIVDVSYTCEIGKDVEVKYYLSDGSERTKTETRWEPFSGTANDGGTTTFCAFGDETKIEALFPYFSPSTRYDYEAFVEHERYPLKRRPDKSAEEAEKYHQIAHLEYECEHNLPGDHSRNFKSNGRCMFGETKAFYYIPTFSLIAHSNEHKVAFSVLANKEGRIRHVFLEGAEVANAGDETMPKEDKARGIFRKTSFGIVSLICVILLPLLIGASVILAITLSSGYYLIGVPIYLAGLITVVIFRRKSIDKILDHLVNEFRQRKLLACKNCLEANNLEPLTEDEERYML